MAKRKGANPWGICGPDEWNNGLPYEKQARSVCAADIKPDLEAIRKNEVSYRRGAQQGAMELLRALEEGCNLDEAREYVCRTLAKWRYFKSRKVMYPIPPVKMRKRKPATK